MVLRLRPRRARSQRVAQIVASDIALTPGAETYHTRGVLFTKLQALYPTDKHSSYEAPGLRLDTKNIKSKLW